MSFSIVPHAPKCFPPGEFPRPVQLNARCLPYIISSHEWAKETVTPFIKIGCSVTSIYLCT